MKRFLLSILICCSFFSLEAQFVTKEQPLGLTLYFAQKSIYSITLGASELPDMLVIEEEDLLMEKETGMTRVAAPVCVNYMLDNSGSWTDLPDGSRLWQLDITLPGALALMIIENNI